MQTKTIQLTIAGNAACSRRADSVSVRNWCLASSARDTTSRSRVGNAGVRASAIVGAARADQRADAVEGTPSVMTYWKYRGLRKQTLQCKRPGHYYRLGRHCLLFHNCWDRSGSCLRNWSHSGCSQPDRPLHISRRCRWQTQLRLERDIHSLKNRSYRSLLDL